MSFRDITGWLVCVFGAAFSVWALPKLWRNEGGFHSDTPHPWWPWGIRLWRASVRAAPLGCTVFIVGAVIPLTWLVTDELWNGVVTGILAMTGAAIFSLGLTIILFNRPKRIVAPHHRHQRGLIAELSGKRSSPTPPPKRLPAWQRERGRGAPAP